MIVLSYAPPMSLSMKNSRNFKRIFWKNGYPEKRNECFVACFVNMIFSRLPTVSAVPKFILYFSLPFTGQHFVQNSDPVEKVLLLSVGGAEIRG